jgi:hypothetical protein
MLTAAILFMAGVCLRAQDIPLGRGASDFNSVDYFEAPHQQQVKSCISGTEAEPLAGGLLMIKGVRLEHYDVDGKLQFIVETPECIYDPNNGIATSPSDVHMRTGDDQLHIDGQGFLWRQSDSFFTISNQSKTVYSGKTILSAPLQTSQKP